LNNFGILFYFLLIIIIIFYLFFFFFFFYCANKPYFTIPYNVFFGSYSAVTNIQLTNIRPESSGKKREKSFTIRIFFFVQKVATRFSKRTGFYAWVCILISYKNFTRRKIRDWTTYTKNTLTIRPCTGV
jgi:hypothetical protein